MEWDNSMWLDALLKAVKKPGQLAGLEINNLPKLNQLLMVEKPA